jgi:hypothetical protein
MTNYLWIKVVVNCLATLFYLIGGFVIFSGYFMTSNLTKLLWSAPELEHGRIFAFFGGASFVILGLVSGLILAILTCSGQDSVVVSI